MFPCLCFCGVSKFLSGSHGISVVPRRSRHADSDSSAAARSSRSVLHRCCWLPDAGAAKEGVPACPTIPTYHSKLSGKLSKKLKHDGIKAI